MNKAPALSDFRRVVVKVGSSLLIDAAAGVKEDWLASLAADIAALHGDKRDVLVVSSADAALAETAWRP